MDEKRRKIPIRYVGSKEGTNPKMQAYWLQWMEKSKHLSMDAQGHTYMVWISDECSLLVDERISKEIEARFSKFVTQAGDLRITG